MRSCQSINASTSSRCRSFDDALGRCKPARSSGGMEGEKEEEEDAEGAAIADEAASGGAASEAAAAEDGGGGIGMTAAAGERGAAVRGELEGAVLICDAALATLERTSAGSATGRATIGAESRGGGK